MNAEKVNSYIAICKEQKQRVDASLFGKLQDLLKEVSKVTFHYNDRKVEWEFWFREWEQWYQLRIGYDCNWMRLCLNNAVVVETKLQVSRPSGDTDITELLDWMTDWVKEDIRLVLEGSYEEKVLRKIPDSCRTGLVSMRYVIADHRKKGFKSALRAEEVEAFYKLKSTGYRLINRPRFSLSLEDISRGVKKASMESGWGEFYCEPLGLRTDGTLDEWFEECAVSHGSYDAIELGKDLPVGLWVCRDEEGYFLQIMCNLWEFTDEAIRFYLVMVGQKLPVWLPHAEDIKDAIDGIERIAIVPENNMCEVVSRLYPPNTFVSRTAHFSEVQDTLFPNKVTWAAIADPAPMDEWDGLMLSKILEK